METFIIALIVVGCAIVVAGILFALVAPFVAGRREAAVRERDGLTRHDAVNYRGPARGRGAVTRR